MTDSPDIQALWTAACRVREQAYAPYSKYKVGAALTCRDHAEIYTGCNVENASYGATICAERSAVTAAVSVLGHLKIRNLVLVTKSPAPPCGMCLQVLAEFSDASTQIFLASPVGIGQGHPLSDFLPHQFDPSHLEPPHE